MSQTGTNCSCVLHMVLLQTKFLYIAKVFLLSSLLQVVLSYCLLCSVLWFRAYPRKRCSQFHDIGRPCLWRTEVSPLLHSTGTYSLLCSTQLLITSSSCFWSTWFSLPTTGSFAYLIYCTQFWTVSRPCWLFCGISFNKSNTVSCWHSDTFKWSRHRQFQLQKANLLCQVIIRLKCNRSLHTVYSFMCSVKLQFANPPWALQ